MRVFSIAVSTLLMLLSTVGSTNVEITRASFDLSKVAYYSEVKKALDLTSEQKSMLAENGFVSAEIHNTDTYGQGKLRRT